MTINDRIKEIRKASGKSQLEFGKSIGVSESAVSNYESGRRAISEQTIQLVCREYHINYDWLVDGTGDMTTDKEEDQIISALQETYDLSELDTKIIKGYLGLSEIERKAFRDLLQKIKDA